MSALPPSTRGRKRDLSPLQSLLVSPPDRKRALCDVRACQAVGAGVANYPHPLSHPLSPPLPIGVSVVPRHNQGRSSFLFSRSLLAWSSPAGAVPSGAGEDHSASGDWERLSPAQLPRPRHAHLGRGSDRSALRLCFPKLAGLLFPPDPQPQPTWRTRYRFLPFSGTYAVSLLSLLFLLFPSQL